MLFYAILCVFSFTSSQFYDGCMYIIIQYVDCDGCPHWRNYCVSQSRVVYILVSLCCELHLYLYSSEAVSIWMNVIVRMKSLLHSNLLHVSFSSIFSHRMLFTIIILFYMTSFILQYPLSLSYPPSLPPGLSPLYLSSSLLSSSMFF